MKMLFCGDMAFTKSTGRNTILSNSMREVFNNHDFRCVNFECAMTGKKQKKIGPSLCLDESMKDAIKAAGFDLFCLANNHIMDEGADGLKRIMEEFSGQNMTGAGMNREEAYRPYIFKRSGISVGILNIAENGFGACIGNGAGYAWFMDDTVQATLQELKANCDYVIVMAHAGAENWNYPLPEIRSIYKRFIDWGADVVIGNHPHTAQGWEVYKEKYIYYSLGNFAFYEGENAHNHTHSLLISITVDADAISCVPIYSCFKDNTVTLSEDRDFIDRINKCNNLLLDEERYIQCVNENLRSVYDQIRESYSAIVGLYAKPTAKNIAKTLIKRYIWKERFNDLRLYHNLQIETHLWMARRASMLVVTGESMRC